jgi:hypothetical protein
VLLTTVQLPPAGELVTVYVEATASAVNATATAPVPAHVTVGVAKAEIPAVIAAEADEIVDVVAFPLGVTVKVYDVPLARPVTVQLWAPEGGVVVFTTTHDPLGEPVIVYRVAVPSAVKLTLIAPEPALLTVGLGKALVAVTAVERPEAVEVVPLPLAATENWYGVPLVRPDTVQLCEPVGAVVVFATRQVKPPGDEVTTYVEATPSAVKVTAIACEPATAAVGVARAVEAAGVNGPARADPSTTSPLPLGVTETL